MIRALLQPLTIRLPLFNLNKLWPWGAEQSEQGSMSYEQEHQDHGAQGYSDEEALYDAAVGRENHRQNAGRYRDEIFSKRVPAGKRTYFFDVKTTRSGEDFFITITESKRLSDGRYEKHKVFLYKEDFGKFMTAMHEVVQYIRDECLPAYDFRGLPEVLPAEDYEGSYHDDEQDY